MKYLICGKVVQINFRNIRNEYVKAVASELDLYPEAPKDSSIDLDIGCDDVFVSNSFLSRNPSTHIELEHGYISDLPHSIISYELINGQPKVRFSYKGWKRNFNRKLRGMQFTHPYEEAGQILHEAVLMPSFLHFFSDQLSLIHGASLVNKHGEAILFGGAGGVGKTTMELDLIFNREYKFLSDDISIVDSSGMLHANYNYPKIYAYNITSGSSIYNKLFLGRSIWDRLWWSFQTRLKPSDKVRRRANCGEFYSSKLSLSAPLKRIYLLFKSNSKKIMPKFIDPKSVACMNMAILKTEFPVFVKHMHWHAYNRDILKNTLFNYNTIFQNALKMQQEILKNVSCQIVQIPMDYSAERLRNELPSVLGL